MFIAEGAFTVFSTMSRGLHFSLLTPRLTLEDDVDDDMSQWYLYVNKADYEQCLTLFDPRDFRDPFDEILSKSMPMPSTGRRRHPAKDNPKDRSLCARWLIACRAFLFFLF